MIDNFSRRHKLDYEECDLHYEYIPNRFRFDLIKLTLKDCDDRIGAQYCLYRGASVSINKDYYKFFGEEEIAEFYTRDLFIDLIHKAEWHEVLSIIE